jgi:hypothetical protein
LLDPVEEPFDPVAGAVQIGAEADWIVAIAFRRDVGPCAFLHGKLSDPIGHWRFRGKADINQPTTPADPSKMTQTVKAQPRNFATQNVSNELRRGSIAISTRRDLVARIRNVASNDSDDK